MDDRDALRGAHGAPAPPRAGEATLIASGIGGGALADAENGGLFKLAAGGFTRIDRLATTGLAVSPQGDRLARLLSGHERPQAPGHVLVYDRAGIQHLHRVDELQDAHDVAWSGAGEIIVVSTGRNAVLWLDEGGRLTRRWEAPGDGDAWHVNCLDVAGDVVHVSAFGQDEAHLGWRGAVRERRPTGIVARLDGPESHVVVRGLRAPHDPTALGDGTWLVNDSGTGRLLHLGPDGTILQEASVGGWTRGLALAGDRVHVGISRRRHTEDAGRAGEVVALRLDGLTEVGRWAVPSPEVFSLVWVTPQLLAGLEAGFAGTSLGALDRPGLASAAARSNAGPLPEADRSARLVIGASPKVAAAESWIAVEFTVSNLGSAQLSSTGAQPVRVGGAWRDVQGKAAGGEARADLPVALLPGEFAEGTLRVPVPAVPGAYTLKVGVLQEGVAWFEDEAPARLRIDVTP